MALSAGSYRGRVGSQAYPQNFLRQYDTSVYRPARFQGLGQAGPIAPIAPRSAPTMTGPLPIPPAEGEGSFVVALIVDDVPVQRAVRAPSYTAAHQVLLRLRQESLADVRFRYWEKLLYVAHGGKIIEAWRSDINRWYGPRERRDLQAAVQRRGGAPLAGLGALVPMPQLGFVRRRYRSIGLLRLFGL